MDKQLKDFISQARKAGQSDLQIMESLTATGWEEEQILNALRPDLEPPKNTPVVFAGLSPKILIAAGGGLIVLLGLVVVLLIFLPQKSPANKKGDKKNTSSDKKNEKSTATSTEERTLHPVGSIAISTKKIHTSTNSYSSTVFFFDIANQKELSGFPELNFSTDSQLQMSNFSPDGKYVFFKLSKYSLADDGGSAKIYIYNAVKHNLKKLFDISSKNTQKLEKTLYSGYLNSPVWLDEKHAYVAYGLEDDYTKYAYSLSVDGSGAEIPFPNNDGLTKNNIIKYKKNRENIYKETYTNIQAGPNNYDYILNEKPIGIYNNQLVAYRQLEVEPIDDADSEKFQKLVQQIVMYQQTRDASGEAAVRQSQAEYFSNKKPSAIALIDMTSGNTVKSFESLGDGWKSLSAFYEPFSKNVYIYQSDFLFTPTHERIAKFNLEKEEPISSVKTFEISQEVSKLADVADNLIFDYEGEYIYFPRTEYDQKIDANPKYYIYQIDTLSGETKKICGDDCTGVRLFNPNLFVN